ncbi:MAG TPA: dihydropyrimidinase [Solirubrobacterales bacterium]|nr:dihydropyrimidinase [Solirubrobacterales bacterium]
MRTLVAGGRLISAEGDQTADVWIEDGRIAAVGSGLPWTADRTIDAAGRYVLPGCVDVHTHMEVALIGNAGEDDGDGGGGLVGETTADDFASGTRAAAFGGTTTIVDFAEQAPGQTLQETVDGWHAKLARAEAPIDVGFHLIARDLGEHPREELAALVEDGVTSVKLFMAYKGDLMVDDDTLWRAMELAAELDSTVMVHAENGDAIHRLVERARAEGKRGPEFHAATRPCGTEVEAVGRAIELAKLAGCALYVVHVSCAGSVERIEAARAAGWPIFAETCTHYLFADESDLARPEFEGAKYVFTPPPRRAGDRERLWRALRTDALSAVSSDHSPASFDARKRLGRDDFAKIPNGTGGVEERLMLLHHHGVNAGRISLNRMVELLATNPAKLLGLHPRKGTLAVGADADLVVFDPEREVTLSAADLHSRSDHTIYEGQVVRGAPETVLVRGEPVVDRGELVAPAGWGEFVPRQPARRRWDTAVAR